MLLVEAGADEVAGQCEVVDCSIPGGEGRPKVWIPCRNPTCPGGDRAKVYLGPATPTVCGYCGSRFALGIPKRPPQRRGKAQEQSGLVAPANINAENQIVIS